MDPNILTKTEYAAYRGVTPAALSQWLSKGRLTGAAIVGQGRNARINVRLADQQLANTLDLGQQFARGGQPDTARLPPPAPINDDEPAENLFTAASRRPAQPAPQVPADGGLGDTLANDPGKRFNAAKAEIAEMDLADRKEKQLAKRGTYILTTEARATFARDLAQFVRGIEQWLPDAAGVIASEMVRREAEARAAGKSSVPMTGRELSVLLMREWHALRKRLKEQADARRAAAPSLITVPLTLDEEAAPPPME